MVKYNYKGAAALWNEYDIIRARTGANYTENY